MKRKILSVFLILLMLLNIIAFAGCKKPSGETPGGDENKPPVAPEIDDLEVPGEYDDGDYVYDPSEGLVSSGTVDIKLNALDNDVKHDVGSATDTGWFAAAGISEYSGSTVIKEGNTGVLALFENLRLPKGYYQITAEINMPKKSQQDPFVEMHLIDPDYGVIAASYIMGGDGKGDFYNYVMFVRIDEEKDYSFQIYNSGRSDLTVNDVNIVSIGVDDVITDTSGYLDGFDFKEFYAPSDDAADAENAMVYDPDAVYYFDLKALLSKTKEYIIQYDTMMLISALQGLANREKITLYINYITDSQYGTAYSKVDEFWLDYLYEYEVVDPDNVVEITGLDTLLRIFDGVFYDGLTVWDPTVASTSNVALTDCGVNNRLPVRYSAGATGLYHHLYNDLQMRVRLNMVGKFTGEKGTKIWNSEVDSSGSKKCDAYLWAVERYIKTEKTNPYVLSCYVDGYIGDNGYSQRVLYNERGGSIIPAHPESGGASPSFPVMNDSRIIFADLLNRDYIVQQKGFFYDLLTVDDDLPNDDFTQDLGTDYKTLTTILSENVKHATEASTVVFGFIPWSLKYSKHANPDALYTPGTLEGKKMKTLPQYNACAQADAYSPSTMANASVYNRFPAPEQYDQSGITDSLKAAAKNAVLENKNYIMVYMGDYDNSAWLYRSMPSMMNDPKLGEVPLMWPVLSSGEGRIGMVYNYMYDKIAEKTDNNIFVGGNNGIGYAYNNLFLDENGNDTKGYLALWKKQCLAMYSKYDLDIMGFYFGDWIATDASDPVTKAIYDMWSEIAPEGVVMTYTGKKQHYYRHNGTIFTCYDEYANRQIHYQPGVYGMPADWIVGQAVQNPTQPVFHVVRTVLATPTQVYNSYQTLLGKEGYDFEIVDAYTFFALYEKHMDNLYGE